MMLFALGLVLVASGALYLWKPAMFRRGLWMKTSIAIRSTSEEGYLKYMRGLGVLYIVIGLGLMAYGIYYWDDYGLDALF